MTFILTVLSHRSFDGGRSFFTFFLDSAYQEPHISIDIVGRYVRKGNNELVKETISGETGVIFWSAVYLSGQD